jgi:hypothetical protein
MTEQFDDAAMPERPLLRRYLHALAEAVGIFVFGGGLFIVGAELLCLNNHYCNNMGGVAFFVLSFLVTLVVCGLLVSFFARFRTRLGARKKLDIAVGVAAVFLWVLYFYRFV